MKRMNLRKTLSATVLTGGTIVTTSVLAETPQGAYGPGSGMMGGYSFGWMGGYGGMWLPTLVVIAVAGFVAWIVSQKKK